MRAVLVASVVLIVGTIAVRAESPQKPSPKVVTKAMVREIASGKLPLESLIDPKRGLVVVEHWQGCAEPAPPPKAEKLCGDALAKRLPELVKRIDRAVQSSKTFGGFSCQNKPTAACQFPAWHCEWGPELRFTVDPTTGVRLDSVLELEVAAMAEPYLRKQQQFVKDRLAALETQECKTK